MRGFLVGLHQQRRILAVLDLGPLEQLLLRPDHRLQQQSHDPRTPIPRLPSVSGWLQRHGGRLALPECGERPRGPEHGVFEQHGRVHVEPGQLFVRVCGAVVQYWRLRTV